jgi:hypothetical protein
MNDQPEFERPQFSEAVKAWTSLLGQRGFATDCVWIFEENLCFERNTASPSGFCVGFQTAITPPPPDAGHLAFDHFSDSDARLVFYRLGSCRGKSVCLVLCDAWFDSKGEPDGYARRDEWLMSFRPGGDEEVAEITNEQRWKERLLRDRPLHDLDFCMTLRTVHELMAYGRELSTYERYGLKFLHAWRRLVGSE